MVTNNLALCQTFYLHILSCIIFPAVRTCKFEIVWDIHFILKDNGDDDLADFVQWMVYFNQFSYIIASICWPDSARNRKDVKHVKVRNQTAWSKGKFP